MGEIILISGDRGAGKTNLCAAAARGARQQGWDTAGLLSLGGFYDGRKVEIDVVDVRTSERRLLARMRPGRQPQPAEGTFTDSWNFEEEAIDWSNERMRQAVPCDLLVVDELGQLEFERGAGFVSSFDAVGSGDFRLALVAVRSEYIEAAAARWPQAEIWSSQHLNPNSMQEKVLERLNGRPEEKP